MFIDPTVTSALEVLGALAGGAFLYNLGVGRRHKQLAQLEAIALGDAEETLKLWISNAAASTSDKQLCRHFRKHIAELFDETKSRDERETWSATTHNLLDIYDRLHEIEHSPGLRVGRMLLLRRMNDN
jgi:tRNA-dihydrouridine synthase